MVVDVAGLDPKALRKVMDMRGMTATQLAQACELNLSYVARMTQGRRLLKRNPALRRRLADALQVPVHWIEHQDDAA